VAPGALPILTLTLIRIVLALFWLSQITWMPPPTFGCPGGLCLWVAQQVQHPLWPVYAGFLTLVQGHVQIFGWFAVLLEALVGVSLLLGLYTRFGGLLGLLWATLWLVGLAAVPGETVWYYLSLVLLNALFFAIGGSTQISTDVIARSRSWWAAA
jgi:hypothetical protein